MGDSPVEVGEFCDGGRGGDAGDCACGFEVEFSEAGAEGCWGVSTLSRGSDGCCVLEDLDESQQYDMEERRAMTQKEEVEDNTYKADLRSTSRLPAQPPGP